MKSPNPLWVVALFLNAGFAALAQQSSDSSAMSANFCLIKIYGTNACTAKCDMRVLSDEFKESSSEGFALLDGKTRQEIDMSQFKAQMIPPAAMKQMGIDQQIIILRPDLKLSYSIYPRLKSYVKTLLSKDDNAVVDNEPKMETTELGKEDVEGHPCVKNKVVVTTGGGKKYDTFVWFATDLKNFPLRIQTTEENSSTIDTYTYKQIQFIPPDAKLFEPPAGFTEYTNFEEMMDATQTNGAAGFDTNAASAESERLATVVDFTLQKGTNRPIRAATAKAFGLGDEKIPATQLILSRKEDTLIHLFGVSTLNTNDLFVARVDGKKQTGTGWFTSRNGKIRATILTSTNGPPEVVANESHADEFEEEINLYLQFVTPPPWEDAPHPLNVVAKFGSVQDVNRVFQRDPAALNGQDDEGMTPLACAVVQEQNEVVRFLLDKGADPNIPNKNGLTPLEHACGREKTNALMLAQLLLAKGALLNATNVTRETIPPLEWAISLDNTELVKLLIDRGADVKAKSDLGSTPLHSAAERGNLEIAEILIAHGADVNAKINGGTTPLHQAAWGGAEAVMKLLLSKGAEADARRSDGLTPLINAAGSGAASQGNGCVEILLAKGVNINATDEDGETALHKAAYYGNKDVVEILLAHGAAINATNKNGKTPLKVASKPEIAELLRQNGAKE
jgi:ankyrin repeat protein